MANRIFRILVLFVLLVVANESLAKQPVVVISIDGMDQRYLSERDKLGLKIPNLRRLIREGQWSAGVVGVVPTVTWPSHTTMITGLDPTEHGILNNRRPSKEGGNYYWSVDLLKTTTLLDAAHSAGLKTATITWPVTVDAASDFNLPEYFGKRQGASMDLRTMSTKANPRDLPERITKMFPSFHQEWVDDRTRILALRYVLRTQRPDFTLVHLVDLDNEAHANGPFTPEALSVLEYQDELIGTALQDLPSDYVVVVVSDHGFEKIEREVNLNLIADQRGVKGLRPQGGIVLASDSQSYGLLRDLQKDPKNGIGREIPKDEIRRFAPDLAGAEAIFESAAGVWFGSANVGDAFQKPEQLGEHGHWPTRYRAVFLVKGPEIRAERLPEISMKDIAQRLAILLGISFRPAPRQ
jgi:predicted AlkP superfamily pyrophosphatase or phosphodiesterase